MTNYEKITGLELDEFADNIQKLTKDPLFTHYDFKKWLNSQSEDPVFKGIDGVWHVRKKLSVMNKGAHKCVIIQDMMVNGVPYKTVIAQNDLGKYQLYIVPEEDITVSNMVSIK